MLASSIPRSMKRPGRCLQSPEAFGRFSKRHQHLHLGGIASNLALLFYTHERPQSAISPRRDEDFPEWYQQVVRAADLAENSEVRGCMVIKPWGYGLWENIQRYLECTLQRDRS